MMTPKDKAMKKLCSKDFIGYRDIEYPQAYDAQVKKISKILDDCIKEVNKTPKIMNKEFLKVCDKKSKNLLQDGKVWNDTV